MLLWAVHNAYFRRYEIEDATTTATAYFFGGVFRVSLEPLTSTQLANMFAMYGVGWTAAFACVALMYLHARRRREPLGLDDLAVYDAGTHARHYAMLVLVGLISVALAVGQVGVRYGVPGHAFLLLGPFCWWNGVHRARGRAAVAAARFPRSTVTPPTTLAR